MYLKSNGKKIELVELTKFWDRLKGFKFYFEPITYGIRFPKKRFSTTNFLIQKIDVLLTDKDDIVLGLYKDCPSEKYIFSKKGVYYTYFLPVNSIGDINIGDKLKIFGVDNKKKSKKKNSK